MRFVKNDRTKLSQRRIFFFNANVISVCHINRPYEGISLNEKDSIDSPNQEIIGEKIDCAFKWYASIWFQISSVPEESQMKLGYA